MNKKGFDYRKLKKFRLEKGLSQRALTKALQTYEPEITRNSLWQWEKGIHQPSFRYLSALCSYFGVKIDDFMRA